MSAPSPGWLDPAAARRALARAARGQSAPDPLVAEIDRRMAERLDYVRLDPRRVLEIRCGPAGSPTQTRTRYPRAEHIALDPIPHAQRAPARRATRLARVLGQSVARSLRRPVEHALCASGARLPLAPSKFQLVWSNLVLAAHDDPAAVLHEWHRVLEVGGLLMFTTLGPDTLKELRGALAFDPYPHVHPFTDMHDLGDMLVAAGFAEPVIDMEMVTLTYAAIADLVRDVRRAGATNAHSARRRGLTGRGIWDRARRAYDELAREGRLPVTVEVIYGHAWKPAPRTVADGRQIMRFDLRRRDREPG